jgi:germination protein M
MRRIPGFLGLSLALTAGLALVACVPPVQEKAVVITSPKPLATVTSPLQVIGTADVFEGTFRLQLLDATGHVLVDRQVVTSCGTGCRAPFDVSLPFTSKPGILRLFAYRLSPKDGHRINLAVVYVRIAPPPATTAAPPTT